MDFTKDFWVRQAVKGYRKSHKCKDARWPVSFSNLQAIFEGLGSLFSCVYEVALFKGAFSLAFFGAFQISELVSPSRTVPREYWCKMYSVAGNGCKFCCAGERQTRRARV